MTALRQTRIVWARTMEVLGWAGVAGLLLCLVAALVLALAAAQRAHPLPLPAVVTPPPQATTAAALPEVVPSLSPLSDVPLLLTQIKQIATRNRLGWGAADYRITPATDQSPATLEVRCVLRGPYPQLRRLIAQVLREVPNATLGDLSLSRSSSDAVEVDAKLVIIVLLQDAPMAALASALAASAAKGVP